jgi:hypothetical protein
MDATMVYLQEARIFRLFRGYISKIIMDNKLTFLSLLCFAAKGCVQIGHDGS